MRRWKAASYVSFLLLILQGLAMSDAMARDIALLSAGAVQPGLVKVIEAFERQTGRVVDVEFATAPEIAKRNSHNTDLIIAPQSAIEEWVIAGKAGEGERVRIGRIGVGVMVRRDSAPPRIATVDEFRNPC